MEREVLFPGVMVWHNSIECDDEFIQKNLENKTTDAFTMPDSVKNNPKISKKYVQFIESQKFKK